MVALSGLISPTPRRLTHPLPGSTSAKPPLVHVISEAEIMEAPATPPRTTTVTVVGPPHAAIIMIAGTGGMEVVAVITTVMAVAAAAAVIGTLLMIVMTAVPMAEALLLHMMIMTAVLTGK